MALRLNKKDRDALVERVQGIADSAAEMLGMQYQYELTHIFDDGHDGDDAVEGSEIPQVYTTCAVTTAQWQYKRAQIRWYLPICATHSDESLFTVAVHELVHVLLNPVDSLLPEDEHGWYSERNEFATESVTRAILTAAGLL